MDMSATVELDSRTIGSFAIRDLSLGGVASDLHDATYDGRVIVTVEMYVMTSIQGELANSDKNIYCMKFSDPNITSTATLEGVIDEIAANGGGGEALGVEKIT